MVAGGAPAALKANTAGTLLRKIRPKTPPEATRKALAWDLVREIRSIDTRLASITAQMTEALQGYGSRLLEVDGVGPVEGSSGGRAVYPLLCSGDRELNSALRLVAGSGDFDCGDYCKVCGVAFWELISGEPDVYLRLVEPFRTSASSGFMTERDQLVKRLSVDLAVNWAMPDGSLDLGRIVRLGATR